jgi:hypothetical protein
MNCQGSAKIKDVIDFLCNEDSLFKWIDGAPTANKKKRTNEETVVKASDFIELRLVCEIKDEAGNAKQHDIILENDLHLDNVKKYIFGLIECFTGETKYMPLHYSLKNAELSTYKKK